METQQQLTETGLEIILVSGDQRLLDAAHAEGLATENPFTYAHLDAPQ